MNNYSICLLYSRINENLESVIFGLDLKEDDHVLAIASSGDAGFAILEFVKKVVLVDREPVQLDYVARRKQLLENGDSEGFRSIPPGGGLCDNDERYRHNYDFRELYFSDNGRLSRIRRKLGQLSICSPKDILDVATTKKGFSKIYFSNCFPIIGIDKNLFTSLMSKVAANVEKDALLYIAEHCICDGKYYLINRWESDCLDRLRKLIPATLSIDQGLTEIARSHEISDYSPVVYRRL